jgi:hypothetical protein
VSKPAAAGRSASAAWVTAGGLAAVSLVATLPLSLLSGQDGVDLNSVRTDLASVVTRTLEPAHLSVWLRDGG